MVGSNFLVKGGFSSPPYEKWLICAHECSEDGVDYSGVVWDGSFQCKGDFTFLST